MMWVMKAVHVEAEGEEVVDEEEVDLKVMMIVMSDMRVVRSMRREEEVVEEEDEGGNEMMERGFEGGDIRRN